MEHLIQQLNANYDVAINFHGVGEPKRQLEPGEDRYWISEDFFAAIITEVKKCRRNVLLTFDDGNASDLAFCAPLLVKSNLTAIFCVLAGRMDTPGSLSASNLHTLLKMNMRIGNHGYDHVDWMSLDETGFNRESRDVIEKACGVRTTAAAIPFGKYNRRVLGELAKAGYSEIYSSDGGQIARGYKVVPRSSARHDMSIDYIRNALAGREMFLKRLRRHASMTKKHMT
jgi:peptidoglycan/xylan/chitin deacetylase (PgdA/CDA1 family)